MFPIQCKEVLPIDHIYISSISVRGALGPLTIWVTKDKHDDADDNSIGNRSLNTNPSKWRKVYSETHKPSFRNYFDFNVSCAIKIKLKPGEIKGMYYLINFT